MSTTTGVPMSEAPRISILMPTFKHAWIIQRAIASVLWQDFTGWELLIIDDGSPDETNLAVEPYVADPRIHYQRLPRNGGLGAALNVATGQAQGEYLAYLPSDDLYHPDHLASLVAVLDAAPEVDLVYAGVRSHRHWWGWSGLTLHGAPLVGLQGEEAVGREKQALAGTLAGGDALGLTNHNVFALVQVLHRRASTSRMRWDERGQVVSDHLEPDFWRKLLSAGCRFASSGRVTCEWSDHPEQRHKIIAEAFGGLTPLPMPRTGRGLAAYRQYYGVPQGQSLNWQPSLGPRVDESRRYAALARPPVALPTRRLKILLVGELGFNPERVLALEEAGHQLFATWIPSPEPWDSASTLPIGAIEQVPWASGWRSQLHEADPDVVYALLNVHALPLVHAVMEARIDVPVVFHFKESPQRALQLGLWRELDQILTRCAGQIFISQENLEWYGHHLPRAVRLDDDAVLVMDGDLPKRDWMTDDWTSTLSSVDGEVHTVSVGRPVNLARLAGFSTGGIHVHLYGSNFHSPDVLRVAEQYPNLHLHETVEPRNWVRELSRYDAAWVHDLYSDNDGDVRKASWGDLNLPARLGTYAAAGLPWLVRNDGRSATAVSALAARLGVGILYSGRDELLAQLRDGEEVAKCRAAMRANRHELSFDHHVGRLESFFNSVIDG